MNEEIIKLIKLRLNKGKKEYGQQLDPFDGRDWNVEALEEILDGMVYIATAILKITETKAILNSNLNNKIREVMNGKNTSKKKKNLEK